MMIGTPPACTGLGSAGELVTPKWVPSNVNVSPAGVDHSPVITWSCSSSRSKRSPSGGKGIAYAWCSCSYQPAPSPSSTRPPDIWSTPATVIASGPGSRNVADVTSVPSRIVEVSRARPASVVQASVGPGSPPASRAPPIARKWSLRKKAPKPSRSARRATASRSSYVAPCWGSVKIRS